LLEKGRCTGNFWLLEMAGVHRSCSSSLGTFHRPTLTAWSNLLLTFLLRNLRFHCYLCMSPKTWQAHFLLAGRASMGVTLEGKW
jgi:hypothetical protein